METILVLSFFVLIAIGILIGLINSKINKNAGKYVESGTNQTKLARIALKSTDWFVRAKAVEKLTDQNVLETVAKNDKNMSVRITAVEKLTDQATLVYIAENDNDRSVRGKAAKKLTNDALAQKVLFEIEEDNKKEEKFRVEQEKLRREYETERERAECACPKCKRKGGYSLKQRSNMTWSECSYCGYKSNLST